MKIKNGNYFSLIIWITVLIAIGSTIGSLTRTEISTWYSGLKRSPLTPPNYVFPIAWSILYALIGCCGWLIWSTKTFCTLRLIKSIYVLQLILNWSWTPLFFCYHLTGLSLLVLSCMIFLIGMIIWLTYPKIKTVSLLMIPYLLWILFASYLNFYIWQHNCTVRY